MLQVSVLPKVRVTGVQGIVGQVGEGAHVLAGIGLTSESHQSFREQEHYQGVDVGHQHIQTQVKLHLVDQQGSLYVLRNHQRGPILVGILPQNRL